MTDALSTLITKVQAARARKDHLTKLASDLASKQDEAETRASNAVLAKELVIRVAEQTQVNIGKRIADLVTLALAAVFEDPYDFQVEFVQRRGGTEADLFFVRNQNQLDPMTASGGGAIDIASFALRLAVWTLNKTHPLFILDEPFRNLSLDLQGKAGLMLQKLAHNLGIQVIMVSHNPEIIRGADKVIALPLV